MAGVSNIKRDRENEYKINSKINNEITIHEFPNSKLLDNSKAKTVSEIFEEAFDEMAKSADLNLVKLKISEGVDYAQFDFAIKGTGIDINDPLEDIRFMFNSNHGIKLPDETGDIIEELKNKEPNIQKINQLLWDQAIIWPLRHYDVGIWAKKDSTIDFSSANIDSLNLDFQFFKWK